MLSRPSLDHTHDGVEQRVGGADVEREDRIGIAAAWQSRQVRDAAEVQHRARLARIRQRGEVEERRERSALAAHRQIARAEVGDRGDAAALGDHRRVADLERRAQLGMVGDGLSVRRDRVDVRERDARFARHRGRRRGETLAEQHVERGELAQHDRCLESSRREPVDAILEFAVEGFGVEGDQPERLRRGVVRPFDRAPHRRRPQTYRT